MGEWKEVAIEEICTVQRGGSPRPIHDFLAPHGTPWIKISDATNGNARFIDATEEFIRPEGESKSRVVEPGAFILSNSATPGLPRFVRIRACIHDGWLLLSDFRDVDEWFLHYKLKDERELILLKGNGSIFTNLKTTILKEHRIALPPLPEQRAIASVLSSLDAKIDLLHRQNKTLEAMAEALFRQWFVEEAEEEAAEGTLADVAVNIRDGVPVNAFNADDRYVALEHIDRRRIALQQFGSSGDVASNKYRFGVSDILFGKLRPYFHKVCLTSFAGICSTDILVIRPKRPELLYYCLFAFFQDEVVEYANAGSGGTRMPRTSWSDLSKYPIALPGKEKLEAFNKVVKPMMDKMQSNIPQIRSLTALRDTLLPKLMSGEVRVEAEVRATE